MKDIQKELVKLAGKIYIERLKKWPETEDEVRVTESVKAASHIILESSAKTCFIYGGHDFKQTSRDSGVFTECIRCGVRA